MKGKGTTTTGTTTTGTTTGRGRQQCFISTHSTDLTIDQLCNGVSQIYFEDFTDNHNKALILVENFVGPGCVITVTIVTRDGQTIVRTVPRGDRGFQVENLLSISISCSGSDPTQVCFGGISIEKTFCLCCP